MNEPEKITLTVPGGLSPPPRLDAWLAAESGLSRERIKKLLESGAVTLSGGAEAPSGKRPVAEGDVWTILLPPPAPAAAEPQDIPLDVAYEDSSVLVVRKPAGLVVHPAAGHPDGTLVNAVLHHCPGVLGIGGEARPGIVHRLDRDTSGLMVVAKTDAAMASLAAAFKEGTVRKTYLAVCCGVPDPPRGHVENLVGRSPRDRKKMAVVRSGGKPASTDWEVAEDFGVASLVRLRIHTGRTHQIRVHMSWLGFPVAGDALYGSRTGDRALPLLPERQMLHAWRLEFPHPADGRAMSFEAPPPADFAALLSALRGAAGVKAKPDGRSRQNWTPACS